MNNYKSKFRPTQTLYVKKDPEQTPYDCVAVIFSPNGIMYELQHCNGATIVFYEYQVDSAESIEAKLGMN